MSSALDVYMAHNIQVAEGCGALRRRLSMFLRIAVLTPGFAFALGIQSCAAQARRGDVAKGEETAARVCLRCHALQSSTGSAPGLAQIANTPHYSTQRLRRIIGVPPHRTMPTLGLKPEEINDLAAYIRSLRNAAP
jgi:mono/diheme cytochrome c family protein